MSWVTFLLYALVSTGVLYFFDQTNAHESRLQDIEKTHEEIQALRDQALRGFDTECIEYKEVPRYRVHDDVQECVHNCREKSCNASDDEFSITYDEYKCLHDLANEASCVVWCHEEWKPWIEFYNESVCVKEGIVRYLS